MDIQLLSNTDPGLVKKLEASKSVSPEYVMDADPVWEINRNRVKLGGYVDEGAFGCVYKAEVSLDN